MLVAKLALRLLSHKMQLNVVFKKVMPNVKPANILSHHGVSVWPCGVLNKPLSKIFLIHPAFISEGEGKNLWRNSGHVRNVNLPASDF